MSQPGANRTLTWWPIAGAAAVALVGVLAIVIFGSGGQSQYGLKTDPDGALTCPPTFTFQLHSGSTKVLTSWVPIAATGIDDAPRLVPDSKPQNVSICQYPAHAATTKKVQLRLEGHKTVTKNLKQAAHALAVLPAAPKSIPAPACTAPGQTYLIGFVYATGAIWVSYPDDGCQYATNGTFKTAANFRPAVESAFQTGHWG